MTNETSVTKILTDMSKKLLKAYNFMNAPLKTTSDRWQQIVAPLGKRLHDQARYFVEIYNACKFESPDDNALARQLYELETKISTFCNKVDELAKFYKNKKLTISEKTIEDVSRSLVSIVNDIDQFKSAWEDAGMAIKNPPSYWMSELL